MSGGRTRALVAALVLLCSCGADRDYQPPAPPESLAALESSWARAKGELAVKSPFPVPVSDLEFMREEVGLPGSDEELLAVVQERKMLAAMGAEGGVGEDFSLTMTYWRALARAYLHEKMEEGHSPDAVPMEIWERIYWDPSVRPKYDHKDTFFVTDVQIVCCKGAAQLCARDEYVQACMRDTEPDIWALHAELSKQDYPTASDLRKQATQLQETTFPALSIKEYSFQYDFTLPHDQQRGYTVFNRNVAFACKKSGVNRIGKPTQSNHGWHIVYVREFHPERHAAFTDPGVLDEIKEHFYQGVKQQDAMKLLQSLIKKHKVKLYEDTLRELDWSAIAGVK